jgi:hypothetical protein
MYFPWFPLTGFHLSPFLGVKVVMVAALGDPTETAMTAMVSIKM